MKILTGAQVKGLKKAADSVTATIEAGGKTQEVTAERVIVAIGIVGNVEKLGLEGTKVTVDRTHVTIDQWCATGEKGSMPSATGRAALAGAQGHARGRHVRRAHRRGEGRAPDGRDQDPGLHLLRPAGGQRRPDREEGPRAGPRGQGRPLPFIGNGKAIALGETEGLAKTVFDAKTGELLGAHLIGPEVTELIQGYTIARTLESTEADLIGTTFPHPTISEVMHEAVLDAYGRTLHF